MITCHVCRSQKVTHYRQLRRDRVWVVTARCENGHIPEKGRPFYSIALFDIGTLPVLPISDPDDSQLPMFAEPKPDEPAQTFLEWFEQKRQNASKFQRPYANNRR